MDGGVGADSYTLTRIDNVAGQLTPYPGLPGTSMVDTGLVRAPPTSTC